MGNTVTRKVRILITASQTEPGSYSSNTIDERQFNIPWDADEAKVARLIQRTIRDVRETVNDFHGPLVEPVAEEATVG